MSKLGRTGAKKLYRKNYINRFSFNNISDVFYVLMASGCTYFLAGLTDYEAKLHWRILKNTF